MSDLIIGNLALLVCALLLAERSYRSGGEHYTSGFAISLSGAFIAASALATLLLSGSSDQDQQTLLRMLNNLAYYAALPLISSALVADALGQNWQKPAWGRWLLALLALFELTRRAQVGLEYSQILAAAVALGMLFATLRARTFTVRLGTALAGIAVAAAALLFGPISLFPAYQSELLSTLAYSTSLLGCLAALHTTHATQQQS